jgi:hypothetical protein
MLPTPSMAECFSPGRRRCACRAGSARSRAGPGRGAGAVGGRRPRAGRWWDLSFLGKLRPPHRPAEAGSGLRAFATEPEGDETFKKISFPPAGLRRQGRRPRAFAARPGGERSFRALRPGIVQEHFVGRTFGPKRGPKTENCAARIAKMKRRPSGPSRRGRTRTKTHFAPPRSTERGCAPDRAARKPARKGPQKYLEKGAPSFENPRVLEGKDS